MTTNKLFDLISNYATGNNKDLCISNFNEEQLYTAELVHDTYMTPLTYACYINAPIMIIKEILKISKSYNDEYRNICKKYYSEWINNSDSLDDFMKMIRGLNLECKGIQNVYHKHNYTHALQYAIKNDNVELFALLLTYGADLHEKFDGLSFFQFCLAHKSYKIITYSINKIQNNELTSN